MKVAIERLEYVLAPNAEDSDQLKAENPDWRTDEIQIKTGINTRYIASPDQTALDLAIQAAEKLLESGFDRERIQATIFVTQSPDYNLPTSACIAQDKLGLSTDSLAFDVNLGCSGFVYGLSVGGALIESGLCENVLLLCADTYSKYIDKADRTCRPIFSDAGAATLLVRSEFDALGPFELGTDGSGHQNLIVPNSGARIKPAAAMKLYMDGAKVFMFTMAKVPLCVEALLAKAKMDVQAVDLFVFHQASAVVLENIIRRLKLPQEKVFFNLQDVGNTVSATIPIALKDAVRAGRLKSGDLVMMVGFGVGYSWGACLLRWKEIA
jgi:3-oxoacyl-[acyl-carrier-protein] synthase-3